jgi:hypothetical protein
MVIVQLYGRYGVVVEIAIVIDKSAPNIFGVEAIVITMVRQ